jgi:hypothetical protein
MDGVWQSFADILKAVHTRLACGSPLTDCPALNREIVGPGYTVVAHELSYSRGSVKGVEWKSCARSLTTRRTKFGPRLAM